MTQVLPNSSERITNYLDQYSKVKIIITPYTLKNAGLFFFNPNAGFSLLGHFIGLFLIFLPRCWVIFIFFTQTLGSAFWVILTMGYFFLPNRWVELVSGETSQ